MQTYQKPESSESDPISSVEISRQEGIGSIMVNDLIREMRDGGQIGKRTAVTLADATNTRRDEGDSGILRRGIRSGARRLQQAVGTSAEMAGKTTQAAKTISGHPAMAFAGLSIFALIFAGKAMDWWVSITTAGIAGIIAAKAFHLI